METGRALTETANIFDWLGYARSDMYCFLHYSYFGGCPSYGPKLMQVDEMLKNRNRDKLEEIK